MTDFNVLEGRDWDLTLKVKNQQYYRFTKAYALYFVYSAPKDAMHTGTLSVCANIVTSHRVPLRTGNHGVVDTND